MQSITVALQDSVADWAYAWAARHQTSLSQMLGELLAEKMRAEESYEAATNEFLAVEPTALSTEPATATSAYPSRDSAHER
jgi:hypothetical protein